MNFIGSQLAPRDTSLLDKKIGAMVRARRTFLRMSQSYLADQVGLTFQQIQKYEKGSNRISAARLKQIADGLGVPITYFFNEFEQSPNEDFATMTFLSTALNIRLLRAFDQIQDIELREGIVKLVETMCNRSSTGI